MLRLLQSAAQYQLLKGVSDFREIWYRRSLKSRVQQEWVQSKSSQWQSVTGPGRFESSCCLYFKGHAVHTVVYRYLRPTFWAMKSAEWALGTPAYVKWTDTLKPSWPGTTQHSCLLQTLSEPLPWSRWMSDLQLSLPAVLLFFTSLFLLISLLILRFLLSFSPDLFYISLSILFSLSVEPSICNITAQYVWCCAR